MADNTLFLEMYTTGADVSIESTPTLSELTFDGLTGARDLLTRRDADRAVEKIMREDLIEDMLGQMPKVPIGDRPGQLPTVPTPIRPTKPRAEQRAEIEKRFAKLSAALERLKDLSKHAQRTTG